MTPTQAQITATGLHAGQRVNHIGQRDSVYPHRAAEGTITGFALSATDMAIIVHVAWDHEGTDAYRPAQIAGAR